MKYLGSFRYLALFLILLAFGCADSPTGEGPTVLLQGVPTGVFEVGSTISITVSAQGSDGGNLTFERDWKPKSQNWTIQDRSEFLTQSKTAIFKWDPLASDAANGVPIEIVFIVKDEAGRRTDKIAQIEIVAGNGEPVFSSNISEIFDPRTGKGLSFEVKVKDQDSESVDLRMDETTAPIGATFVKSGPYSGTFTWNPNPNQLDKRIRTVRFFADDKQFPEVSHDVTIVVRTNRAVELDKDQATQSCADDQIINHVPLGSQSSLEDYKVEATIASGTRFDEVILYWTTADAFNADFDDTMTDGIKTLHKKRMVESNGVYSAVIDSRAGTITDNGFKYLDVNYQICGIDRQALTEEDAIICTPSTGDLDMFYSFISYADTGECADDIFDTNTTGDDTLLTAQRVGEVEWETRHACSDNPDYFFTNSSPGETSFIGITFNQNETDLDFNAEDEDGNVLPLGISPCTGLAILDTSVAAGEPSKKFYIKATGNEAVYHVRKFVISGTGSDCNDKAREPNEDAFSANVIQKSYTFDAEICNIDDIDVYKFDLTAGEEVVITHTFVSANGNLDMTLFSPEQVGDVGKKTENGVAFTLSLVDDVEVITYTAATTGPHYLQVFSSNVGKNSYNLDVQANAAPPCNDADQYKGNHTQDNAVTLASAVPVEVTNLALCPGTPDWFKRTEFNGVPVTSKVRVTGGAGTISDMELELFDFAQNSLGKATQSGTSLEFLFTPSSTTGAFYKVSSSKEVDYVFDLEL